MTMSNLVPVPSVLADQPLLGRGICRDKTLGTSSAQNSSNETFYLFASKTHGTNPKSNVCDSSPECRASSFMMLITFMSGRW